MEAKRNNKFDGTKKYHSFYITKNWQEPWLPLTVIHLKTWIYQILQMKIMSSKRLPTNMTGTITRELNMTNIRLKLRVCERHIFPWGRKGVERVKVKRYNRAGLTLGFTRSRVFIFLIGIHTMPGWTATTRHEVIRKKNYTRSKA